MPDQFTWTGIYRELADRLRGWRERQPDLIAFLEELRGRGLVVTPLSDQDEQGERFLLRSIDPFTFFGVFNRGIREDQRIAILAAIKEKFELKSPVPTDFHGVPLLNNLKSWFISFQRERKPHDVDRLWRVFELALTDNPLGNAEFEKAFDDALDVKSTNINLTQGLFWIRPDVFVGLDQANRQYLDIKLPTKGLSAAFYVKTARDVLARGTPLPQVSYDAYVKATKGASAVPPATSTKQQLRDVQFWMVGAFWTSQDPHDQTQRFIDEGVWQNGYEDVFLDQVREMRVGDRIAIKAVATQKHNLPFDAEGRTISKMTINAIGTIVANRGDGRTVEVEWDTKFKPREWFFYTYRQTVWHLRRDTDLAQKLIDFAFFGGQQDYAWFVETWREKGDDGPSDSPPEKKEAPPYDVDDLLASGVFVPTDDLHRALERLRSKKNLIIQGPPGVGKTFIARRLAYALMGSQDDGRIQMIQFHQSYSYDDFVRGYRPLGEKPGAFGLLDGVFFTFCQRAKADPDRDYVFIIDEINRGNLSQIFGELLMLIESDKRGAEFAVPLVYQKDGEARFHIPPNLHLVGLMNLADRSLAMVDYALRRRFAFLSLRPQFGSPQFRSWLAERQMPGDLIDLIVTRLTALNGEIAKDTLLGENYEVGHSFFCPKGDNFAGLDRAWYDSIVETEIAPLLAEYWFDNKDRAGQMRQKLLD